MIKVKPKEGLRPSSEKAEVLAVLLHAYNHTPQSFNRVVDVVREEYPASDIFAPVMPISTFSLIDPEKIAVDLVARIDELEHEQRLRSGDAGYARIILIGHSLGAIMARKIWALAHGATTWGMVDPAAARSWAGKIDRIVLLAALSRGWMISSALDPYSRLIWSLGTGWGNFCRYVLRREPLIFGFRRGAPFLTTARLQCMAAAASLRHRGGKLPVTVQLLGTADDYVAPTDNVDLVTGQAFYYLEVIEATHRGIVTLEEGQGEGGALARFRAALTANSGTLQEMSLAKEDVFDLYKKNVDDHDLDHLPDEDRKVRHVVFVIHGIRDRGFWTRRIARRIKQIARQQGKQCRSVTSTYGYFPMGSFLLPWKRRSKVEWLLDQYVTPRVFYPAADFGYVGHSNGTYLVAKALELCPAVRFRRIVFAGSVVQRRYDWRRFLPSGSPNEPVASVGRWQLERIVNYVATADWVVALFPYGLERLQLQDLGGAGHEGFATIIPLPGSNVPSNDAVTNIKYIVGRHGAALAAENWDEMAAFILNGTTPRAAHAVAARSTNIVRLGHWAPLFWFILFLLPLGIGVLLLWAAGTPGWIFAILFALYLALLRVGLTKA